MAAFLFALAQNIKAAALTSNFVPVLLSFFQNCDFLGTVDVRFSSPLVKEDWLSTGTLA
jgi:hypothetical protein